jgi:hypothetical protein
MLSDFDTKKYEWKFADTALTTAITSFLATYDDRTISRAETELLDEVLSYVSLLHLATVVRRNELPLLESTLSGQISCGLTIGNGEGSTAILSLYRKYVVNRCGKLNDCKDFYPKYSMALKIAVFIETGDFLSVLKYLSPVEHRFSINAEERWMILSRCCMAQAIPILRMGLLRRYNKCFGKEERVRGDDVSTTFPWTSVK